MVIKHEHSYLSWDCSGLDEEILEHLFCFLGLPELKNVSKVVLPSACGWMAESGKGSTAPKVSPNPYNHVQQPGPGGTWWLGCSNNRSAHAAPWWRRQGDGVSVMHAAWPHTTALWAPDQSPFIAFTGQCRSNLLQRNSNILAHPKNDRRHARRDNWIDRSKDAGEYCFLMPTTVQARKGRRYPTDRQTYTNTG